MKEHADYFYCYTIIMIAVFCRIAYYDLEEFIQLGLEDNIIEWFTALLLGMSGVTLIMTFAQLKSSPQYRILGMFFLVVGILILIATGEEISWAQRIFNIHTPEELAKINSQQELNFHNMNSYLFNALSVLGTFYIGIALCVLKIFGVRKVIGIYVPELPYALAIFVFTVFTYSLNIYFYKYDLVLCTGLIAVVIFLALLNGNSKLTILSVVTAIVFYFLPIMSRKLLEDIPMPLKNVSMEYREVLIGAAIFFYCMRLYSHYKNETSLQKFKWIEVDKSSSLLIPISRLLNR